MNQSLSAKKKRKRRIHCWSCKAEMPRVEIAPDKFVDNSNIGLYLGEYVMIKKYSKEKDQFLVEDALSPTFGGLKSFQSRVLKTLFLGLTATYHLNPYYILTVQENMLKHYS